MEYSSQTSFSPIYWRIETTCFLRAPVIRQKRQSVRSNWGGFTFQTRSPLKKDLEVNRPACSTPPLSDSTFQENPQPPHYTHTPSSLTRLTFPGPHAWLSTPHPAEKAMGCFIGIAASPTSPAPSYHLLDQARWREDCRETVTQSEVLSAAKQGCDLRLQERRRGCLWPFCFES